MTDRTGLGPVELAVLQAIDGDHAGPPGQPATAADVLPAVEERMGLGPWYGYEVLLDLARSWVIAVPLVTARGNIGDRDFPPAEPRHVQPRPSRAGQVILDAEAGALAPVPVGLINGTAYRGGTQPPLEPGRVIAALRHVLDHPGAADADLLEIAGPPYSVTGCTVTGDLDALAAGQPVQLRETGRITLTGSPVPEAVSDRPEEERPRLPEAIAIHLYRHGLSRAQLSVESLPPGVSPAQTCTDLSCHADPDPRGHVLGCSGNHYDKIGALAGIWNLASDQVPVRILVTVRPGTDPAAVRDEVAALHGVTATALAAYPAPLAALLRGWVARHRGEDIGTSLARLEAAIRAAGAAAP